VLCQRWDFGLSDGGTIDKPEAPAKARSEYRIVLRWRFRLVRTRQLSVDKALGLVLGWPTIWPGPSRWVCLVRFIGHPGLARGIAVGSGPRARDRGWRLASIVDPAIEPIGRYLFGCMGLARNSLGSFVENSGDSLFSPQIASSIPNTVRGALPPVRSRQALQSRDVVGSVLSSRPIPRSSVPFSPRAARAWPRETSSSRRVGPAARNLAPNCQRSSSAHPFSLFITHDFATLAKSSEPYFLPPTAHCPLPAFHCPLPLRQAESRNPETTPVGC